MITKKTKANPLRFRYGVKNDSVPTPKGILKSVMKIFNVTELYDPCPLERPDGWDGLKGDWKSLTFCNPPFSDVPNWAEKCIEECKKGVHVVLLVTMRPNNRYWVKTIFPHASRIWILGGRVRFPGYQKGFSTPMCLVEFDPKNINDPPMFKESSHQIGGYTSTALMMKPQFWK